MITLTAKIKISTENPLPFKLGESALGSYAFGEKINTESVIDQRNILSISSDKADRSDFKFPSYGIISNKGNLEFNDTTNRFLGYAQLGVLDKGAPVEIYLNNTLSERATTTIDSLETDEWDYNNDNKVVSVSLKDDLEEWQDINVNGIGYDPRKTESKPFSWLYDYLWEITNPIYPMLSLEELDEKTRNILKSTHIQYPLLESGNLWQQWTKLCQACQLHIYKNNNGVVVCRYNGGN
jgi:hypothetical protein